VSEYLAGVAPSARAEALAFRAVLREELPDFTGARADVVEALGLAADPSYLRYTLELSLASLDERSGDRSAAIRAYLRAIQTAMADGRIAVGTAISKLFDLIAPDDLGPEQRRDVVEAVRVSWRLLNIEGEPDIQDLDKVGALLLTEQSRPR